MSVHRISVDSLTKTRSSQLLTPVGGIYKEVTALTVLAVPAVFSYLIEFTLPIITYLAAGHLGIHELNGLALGTMSANITGTAVIIGLAMAMDTLATQAFGAHKYERVGVLAQRALLVCLVSCLPICLLWWNIELLLLLLGQDPAACRLAGLFLRIFSLYTIPLCVFEVAKKYLAAQGIVTPITYIMLFACLFHAIVTYVLIWPLGLGFIGSPISLVLTYTVLAIMTIIFVIRGHRWFPQMVPIDPAACWGGWTLAACQELGPFLWLAFGALAQLVLEWWAFETLTMLSGMHGAEPLAATSIALQLSVATYPASYGFSVAASIRIGQLLGAGTGKLAKRSSMVAVSISVAISSSMGLIVYLVRNHWAALFTTDPAVAVMSERILFVVAFNCFFDGIQSICGGVLRGTGLQTRAAAVSLVAFWMLGLPGGAVLSFKWGWGVYGLWIGLFCALMILALGQLAVVFTIDWDRQAQLAHSRAVQHEEETSTLLPLQTPL